MQQCFGLDIPESLDEVCNPRRTALIVYDMQVGIVSQLPDGTAVLERVQGLIEAARAGGYRIFYTRHMYLPNEIAGVCQLRTAMAWQRVADVRSVKPHFLRDSPEFQLTPGISPRANEVIFDKIAMSAFVGTPLDTVLRDCSINSFVIAGIALEIGIEPTVRHAMDLAYIPVIASDACGSRDKVAAGRTLASLAFFGGSLQSDSTTLSGVLRRPAVG
jgi:nicotinamidase-related amidase